MYGVKKLLKSPFKQENLTCKNFLAVFILLQYVIQPYVRTKRFLSASVIKVSFRNFLSF